MLLDELRRIHPGAGIIGEEGGWHGSRSTAWIVDPVDGTTNIVHRVPHSAISVALIVDYIPMLGLVLNPFTGWTYVATRDEGAFVARNADFVDRTPLVVSTVDRLQRSLVSFGLPYDRAKADRTFDAASRVFHVSQDLRRRGSAALDLASVASGEMEAHFELDLKIWDIAAASLIVEEAGGRLTDWSGRAIVWSEVPSKLDIVASNGAVHRELLDAVDG